MSLYRPSGFWASGGAGSVPSLLAPTVLDSGSDGTTVNNIVSASIAPAANSLLLCGYAHRHSGNQTVITPTLSGLSITGSWTIIQVGFQQTTGDLRWMRAAILMAQMAASPGTGTIQFNASSNVWQKAYTINQVATGFDTDISSYPTVTNSGEATSLALNFAGAPAADSLLFSVAAELSLVSGAFTPPTGHTALTRVQVSTALDMKDAYDLLSGAQNNSWTALDSDAHAGCAVEVLQR